MEEVLDLPTISEVILPTLPPLTRTDVIAPPLPPTPLTTDMIGLLPPPTLTTDVIAPPPPPSLTPTNMITTHTEALTFFQQWRQGKISVTDDLLVLFFTQWTTLLRGIPPPPDPALISEWKDLRKTSASDPTIRIVLNVMMKNEQPLMSRCIQSALPIVDAVCYSDTGSRGDVFTLLNSIVPRDMPLCVEVEPWKNFGYNRTAGLNQTQRFVDRMGWHPELTFILVMDADMVLNIKPAFSSQMLVADCYDVEQHNGSNVYWNPRLLRVSRQWEVIGRTHEYYSSKLPTHHEKSKTLWFDDRNDGLNRADKYNRDITLLQEDLVDNPRNARAMFYLAETYRNRGNRSLEDYEKSLSYYEMHVAMGSWEEEIWWSKYAIGMCHDQMKNEGMMLKAYLEAYQRRPHRAEPLFKIAKYYRDNGQHWNAMVFFRRASEIPFPASDVLFVDKDIYNYWIMSEMSVSAYYAGDKMQGAACVQSLLRNLNVSHHVRNMAYYNARFYVQPWPSLTQVDLATSNTKFFPLKPKLPSPYRPCNPSLALRDNKLEVVCRAVNYDQQNARNYKVLDDSGVFHTTNVLMTLDPDTLEVLSETPMENQLKGPFASTCQVQGLEDARVVNVGDDTLAFSCTSLEHTSDNRPRICWVELSPTAAVTKVTQITGYKDGDIQKNWLPYMTDDKKVRFVYGYNPFVLLELDINTCIVQPIYQTDLPLQTSGWRGSSGPVMVPGHGYLILIHEICDKPEGRHYMHRFVLMDENMAQFKAASDLFYFKHGSGVEMATGMVLRQNTLYIALGIEDRQAYVMTCDVENVLSNLK